MNFLTFGERLMNKQQLLQEIERLKAQVEQLQEPKTGRVLSLDGFEDRYTVQGTGITVEVTKNYVLHFKSTQSRLEFTRQFSDDDIKLMLMGV